MRHDAEQDDIEKAHLVNHYQGTFLCQQYNAI